MKREHPHIIIEGGVQYQLGKLKGNCIRYDFEKMLIYLDAKGKLMFGKKFKIHKEDREILYKLCSYFIRDKATCDQFGIDIEKGILLTGPVGCGKTSLMRLLKHMVPHRKPYEVIPARNIVFGFNNIGYTVIEQYGDHRFYCFDDLGVEPTGRHFGKDCNVMGEILLSRYDLFLKHRVKTHATTNLNARELEERYGNRVRSRMRELFNLVAFDKNVKDKRV
ncbi:ABC transporter ATP-binding protein [Galbibacter sp. EGI 63066]|uniref:ABC transporter ATP-binding protein n=1 Tax=Galbibacter sp. EGI 63066 TaxID=2993559 RepID=UPI002248C7DF|nr:ABC transporter ATP-binding protein [Galbibacter sp. EGI 63066]MCX2681890.1 ABC transporter ATP-binding protein [Galbibacter sp. EGI 63066]